MLGDNGDERHWAQSGTISAPPPIWVASVAEFPRPSGAHQRVWDLVTEGKHRARRRRHAYLAAATVLGVVAIAGGTALWLQPWAAPAGSLELSSALSPSPRQTGDPSTAQPSNDDLTLPPDRSATLRTDSSVVAGPQFPEGTAVQLIGDSLAVGIAEPLALELAPRSVTVEAEEGRGTSTSAYLLTDHAYATSPIWLVSLGTNDNIEDFADQAALLMDLAGSERCVLWFDVWRFSTDEFINDDLSQLAESHKNLHLLPWHDLAALHPEWFDGEDVHPTQEGYDERMRMAAQGVSDYCTS